MPLRKGKSKATVSANIREIVHDWENDGTIGTSKPKTKKQAVKQAVAISLREAGTPPKKRPKKPKR